MPTSLRRTLIVTLALSSLLLLAGCRRTVTPEPEPEAERVGIRLCLSTASTATVETAACGGFEYPLPVADER